MERKKLRKLEKAIVKNAIRSAEALGVDCLITVADRGFVRLAHTKIRHPFIEKLADAAHAEFDVGEEVMESFFGPTNSSDEKINAKEAYTFHDVYFAFEELSKTRVFSEEDNRFSSKGREFWFLYKHESTDGYYMKYFTNIGEILSVDVCVNDTITSNFGKLCRIDMISRIGNKSDDQTMYVIIRPYLSNGRLADKSGIFPISEHEIIDPDSNQAKPWEIYLDTVIEAYPKCNYVLSGILNELFIDVIEFVKELKVKHTT